MEDVMFSLMEQMGQNLRWHACFVEFTR